jgi:hypothetical protein
MRCVACGVEMQIVRKVPDQSMMVTGHELHTFECLSCQSKEHRLVFTHIIDELPTERMHLPSAFLTSHAFRARFDWMESKARSSFLSWSHFLRKTGLHPGSSPGQAFSGKCSSKHKMSVAARTAWARAVLMIRGLQSRGS